MKNFISRIPDQVLVFLFFYIFFIANLTTNFSGPHDSMGYLNEIEHGKALFHPHHLLYHFTTFIFLKILEFFFSGIKNYYLVEVVDATWGCLGLAVVFMFFKRRFDFSRLEAFGGTCVVAFSFGIWFYNTNIEVYMPSLFFLLTALYIACRQTLDKKGLMTLIIVHCFAILFHQSNILFTPIILWKIWQSRRQLNVSASLVRYCLTGLIIVGGLYFIAGWYINGNNSPESFDLWIRGYTKESRYWFPFNLTTAAKAAIGFGHTIIGGHFLFNIKFISDYINKLFFYHSLTDEPYVVRNLSASSSIALFILTIFLILVVLVLIAGIIARFKRLPQSYRPVVIPLILFLIAYSAFFFFWMPEILEFWLPQCAVFWLLVLGLTKRLQVASMVKRTSFVFFFIAFLLFVINYCGSIYWMKDIRNDIVYAKIEKIKDVATDKDVIILQDGWLVEDFLAYFVKSAVWDVPSSRSKVDSLNRSVTNCLNNGGKVYLYTEGASIHASKNGRYMDSLINVYSRQIRDFPEPLTPIKVISLK